jgi:hypothetical protein
MAIIENNNAMEGMSGKFGNIVYRQWHGKTVACKKQKSYISKTDLQLKRRLLFKEAVAYAKSVIADPDKNKFYQSRVKGAKSAFNLAVSDYMHPPKIELIKTVDNGSLICVEARDNGMVVSLAVKIEKDGLVVEEGNAQVQSNELLWQYVVTSGNVVSGSTISVKGVDMAGRETVKQVIV